MLMFREPKPIHPFPARMAPSIVWEELSNAEAPLRVLDPMAGSGTTLVMARLLGHEAVGIDSDPLAVLIASCWSADLDRNAFQEAADAVLLEVQGSWEAITAESAYPPSADTETRQYIDFWFDPVCRRQLTAFASAIEGHPDNTIRSFLWCAFSRMIITKSRGVSLAMDVSHSRPHKEYETAPVLPVALFPRAVRRIMSACPFPDDENRPAAVVSTGDARVISEPDASVDFVITSPPYLNALDYIRGHRLSLVWMGHTCRELRGLRASNVGTERGAATISDEHIELIEQVATGGALQARTRGMLLRYVDDMERVLSEVSRVLVPGGNAILVLGDSTTRGVFIRNSSVAEWAAVRAGLELVSRRQRPLPSNRRYLPPPSSDSAGEQLQARMTEEVILQLTKV